VNIREATGADGETMVAFMEAVVAERWNRPWPPPEVTRATFEGKVVLLAEENEPLGFAFGEVFPNRVAHLNIVYVRPESRRSGVAKALVGAFAGRVKDDGAEHLTLDVDVSNDVGRTVWQRLGFVEWAQRLRATVEAVEARASGARSGESYASIHVQTDDAEVVEAAVAKYLPRLGGSAGGRVSQPKNGWVAVHAELVDRDRKARERLASELSNATAAVVCAIALEDGNVVRYALYERGSIVDEYQSVPEYFGPLPPGDVVALGANPTVVARLTGAEPARVRAVVRTAASPEELPPAPELLRQIAELMGLEGAGPE
jgi:ribosomal protein S18 acetylase RimI-like enzyme